MPTRRPLESTTGAPLMPRSASNAAKAWTVVFGSTVITSVVITSIARIAYSLLSPDYWFAGPIFRLIDASLQRNSFANICLATHMDNLRGHARPITAKNDEITILRIGVPSRDLPFFTINRTAVVAKLRSSAARCRRRRNNPFSSRRNLVAVSALHSDCGHSRTLIELREAIPQEILKPPQR
jgi:hypothetical protein